MPQFKSVRSNLKLRKHAKSNVYYVYLGHNEYKSLRTKKLHEAAKRADELLEKYYSDNWDSPLRTTLDKELDELLALKKSEVSQSTYDRWEGIVRLYTKPYFTHFNVKPKALQESTWQRYVNAVRKKRPRLTMENHRKVWTMLARQMFHKGVLKRLPEFRKVDKESDAGRAFTDDELKAIIENAGEDLILQILLATHTPRLREILHSKWDQYDLEQGILKLSDIKTGKPKFAPLGDEAILILKKRRAISGSDYVFPSPKGKDRPVNDNRHSWRSACARAGIVYQPYKCRFHDLRGYGISEMLKVHGNVYQVSKIAGNSERVIKKHYDKLKAEDLRQFKHNKRLIDE